MRQQIPPDARKPAGTKGIETRLLDGVKELRGTGVARLMVGVDRGVMEAPLQYKAIGDCAQAALRRRIRLREKRIGVANVD
jgi:hypothetical protein